MTRQLRKRPPKPMDGPGADYEVGYCRPPIHSRYKKGKSGNPKGRTKGSRNRDTVLQEIFNMHVPITEGGKTRNVTTAEAMLLRLREMAFQGKNHAMDRFLKLWLDFEEKKAARLAREAEACENDRSEEVDELLGMVRYIFDPNMTLDDIPVPSRPDT